MVAPAPTHNNGVFSNTSIMGDERLMAYLTALANNRVINESSIDDHMGENFHVIFNDKFTLMGNTPHEAFIVLCKEETLRTKNTAFMNSYPFSNLNVARNSN